MNEQQIREAVADAGRDDLAKLILTAYRVLEAYNQLPATSECVLPVIATLRLGFAMLETNYETLVRRLDDESEA